MDFANSAHFVQHALWDQGGEYLFGKALSLERAGASFIIIAANALASRRQRSDEGRQDTAAAHHGSDGRGDSCPETDEGGSARDEK
jgi:hypothetical protein